MSLPKNVYYYGVDRPLPKLTSLRAGPLSLEFEEGSLRFVRLGEREILRGVYFALRDRNWDTIPVKLSNITHEIATDSFRVCYQAENQQRDIDFAWAGTITGSSNGTVTFSMQGEARSTFLRNRLGLCVLHPISGCAGHECWVEKLDGTLQEARFPHLISPHQPFVDMRAMSYEVHPGIRAEVRFEGEVFETEDQRNWTDASYKTYSTPLRISYPVTVEAGTKIAQSVTLSLQGQVRHWPDRASDDAVKFNVGTSSASSLPAIGLGMATHGQSLSSRELARLRVLNLAHLRVDLALHDSEYESRLIRAATEAEALGVPLLTALTVTDGAEDQLLKLVAVLDRLKPKVRDWLIFHASEKSTTEKWIRLARKHLSGYSPSARIGAGTDAYFAEINRNRTALNHADLICYSVNPQVHASDNTTMVENLAGQAFSIESARQFATNLPIAISPITLNPRFNPNATSRESKLKEDQLPREVDARQMSLFGAGWTAGSLKYVAEAGADTVTYYETTGWRGVIEADAGSPLPRLFRSAPGCVFPLYHVLADVGEFAAGGVIRSTSNAPLKVDGLALRASDRARIIIANLTPEPQLVRVTDASLGRCASVRILDESSVELALRRPEDFRSEPGVMTPLAGDSLNLELRPFAVARIDSMSASR
jgi:hypothetical protein